MADPLDLRDSVTAALEAMLHEERENGNRLADALEARRAGWDEPAAEAEALVRHHLLRVTVG